jgi:RND family efflux transporter MFP subunit
VALQRRQLVLLLGALAVVAAAAVGYGLWRKSHRGGPLETGVIAVTTQPAKVTTMRETVAAAGTVVPQTAADFIVTAPELCSIAELPKQEGDTVQAGDIVARLDMPAVAAEIATRNLEVVELTAKADAARAEAARLTSLFERGLAARQLADAARTALTVAEANLGQAKTRLETAKVSEAATIIRARFAGVVAKRWHNVGDSVSGGDTDPILRIVDMSRLQISAPMPTADAGRVLPGQTADVQSESGPISAVVALKLVAASSTASPGAAATTDIRLNFLAPTTLPLDAPVQISIIVNERANVLVVPADAIQRLDTQTFVWLANGNNQAERREVRIGFISNAQAEIVSGLVAGEQVIVTGISELTEGTRLTIGR